jgi:hypothetical protein
MFSNQKESGDTQKNIQNDFGSTSPWIACIGVMVKIMRVNHKKPRYSTIR